jgi:hypothetical protein
MLTADHLKQAEVVQACFLVSSEEVEKLAVLAKENGWPVDRVEAIVNAAGSLRRSAKTLEAAFS